MVAGSLGEAHERRNLRARSAVGLSMVSGGSLAGVVGVLLATSIGCGKHPLDPPPIAWQMDADAAEEESRRSGRPLLIFVGAEWDVGTMELERKTFADPVLRAFVAPRFVTVRIDGTSGENDLTDAWHRRYEVKGTPTILVRTDDGHELVRLDTYVDASQLLASLERADAASQFGRCVRRRDER